MKPLPYDPNRYDHDPRKSALTPGQIMALAKKAGKTVKPPVIPHSEAMDEIIRLRNELSEIRYYLENMDPVINIKEHVAYLHTRINNALKKGQE